jgi:hypothetical protein
MSWGDPVLLLCYNLIKINNVVGCALFRNCVLDIIAGNTLTRE